MLSPSSLLADLPALLPKELVQTLLSTSNLRIERIVSKGHRSLEGFWYDQETNEWVLLVQGAARLRFEGQELVEMTSGTFINIPAMSVIGWSGRATSSRRSGWRSTTRE